MMTAGDNRRNNDEDADKRRTTAMGGRDLRRRHAQGYTSQARHRPGLCTGRNRQGNPTGLDEAAARGDLTPIGLNDEGKMVYLSNIYRGWPETGAKEKLT
jgi:hypothetical protein